MDRLRLALRARVGRWRTRRLDVVGTRVVNCGRIYRPSPEVGFRGLAATLVLGAAGAQIGTRFEASLMVLVSPLVSQAILRGSGDDTERSRILDIARRSPWPTRYTARTLRNDFLDRWRDREGERQGDTAALDAFGRVVTDGDSGAMPIWAGEAIDPIAEITSAKDLVASIAASADELLRRGQAPEGPRGADDGRGGWGRKEGCVTDGCYFTRNR